MGERIAYVRVSTIEQNEARQVEELKKHDIQKWFIEKVSGKNTDRPELQKMLDYIREGDTVYVHDLSRLSRSTSDLLKLVEFFAKKKVELVSNKENIDSSTPTGKLMLTMIAAINEFERQNLLERQREGIAIAKREHRYQGRKRIQPPEGFGLLYEKYQAHKITKAEIARQLNISRPTVDRLITEKEKEQT